ncbi:hypothetical protein B0A48_13661 [Cryoendolithus antarcticus]|uniref:TeaA receptor TeaR n=1 Tax=Cryoendolithus antarcticus TaxID=1507870 RepID=A0A1V8SPZ1_9PEZI|nr:hypothetical protein B0A48_13661 [Cryoendolithus antarcticus]
MAVATNGQWTHAVQHTDFNADDFSPGQPSEAFEGYTRSNGKVPKRRPSGANMQGERDPQQRRPSVQSNQGIPPRKRSTHTLRQVKPAEEARDDSAWIHRDKLAQIEIQEMEDAGMHVRQPRRSGSAGPGANGRTSRSVSRTGLRRPASRDQVNEVGAVEDGRDEMRRKRVSTIPAADEEEYEQGFDPTMDAELRTPEEVAAEQQIYRQHMLRPSTSRIPISKLSPVPVPSTVVDRESPLTRSRNGSGAWSSHFDELQYARRARSGSNGSHVLLDDGDGVRTPSRPTSSHIRQSNDYNTSNSPPKARMPNKDTPTSGARKASTNTHVTGRPPSSGGPKSVRTSGQSVRPLSSSGKPRPSTSHQRPEGDAPWLATMYKPDPRLPPEEQMLPTHAKRMMQEQWEKDGKTGTAYDRDFRLLNDEPLDSHKPTSNTLDPQQQTFDQPSRISPRPQVPPKENIAPGTPTGNGWPLGSPSSPVKSEVGSTRPGTSGGYRITPMIATPPVINLPSPRGSALENKPVKHNATPRIPDFDVDEKGGKEKKGCMGCVIM